MKYPVKIGILSMQVILLWLLFSNNQLFSQNRVEISGGIGFPEYFNLKIKYGVKFQIGAGAGIFPKTQYGSFLKPHLSQVIPVSFDFYYHFSRLKVTNKYKWYWNIGIIYLNVPYEKEKELYYSSRIGRTIYLSELTGISIDLGFAFLENWRTELSDHRNTASESFVRHEFTPVPYPSGCISYFVKF
jgi:hypothetical protein